MADTANDGYAQYYTEKLWELIPSYYRNEDGLAEPAGVLRAIVGVIAEQAAILRRSQDRLWEDQHVEHADDWAVPYIGDLVATRNVSALLTRARRVDVAKTIYYRRRAGTLRVLEELISDVADWEGVVREGFRRVARAPHALDPVLPGRGGRWSATPPGALADLRNTTASNLSGTPFEEYHRTPDLRKPSGRDGLVGIPRLVFHLYRNVTNLVEGVTPWVTGPGYLTFDPSGRDLQLYQRRTRPQVLSSGGSTTTSHVFETSSEASSWEEWRSALPWELPAPMACRMLGDVAFDLDETSLEDIAASLPGVDRLALEKLYGSRIIGEARLARILTGASAGLGGHIIDIRSATLADDCGKAVLMGDDWSLRIKTTRTTPSPYITVDEAQADDLDPPGVAWQPWEQAAIDAERGRFQLQAPTAAASVDYHYGFPGSIGAGVYERADIPWTEDEATVPTDAVPVTGGGTVPGITTWPGCLHFEDNLTYTAATNFTGVTRLYILSVDKLRPYVRLAADWVFTATATPDSHPILTLEGLWIGASGSPRDIVLQGDWERVEIRCCTFDPGGTASDSSTVHPVGVRVEGHVERLVFQSCIFNRVRIMAGGGVERLDINDSIVDSPTAIPLQMDSGELHLSCATVLGDIAAWKLWVSDSIIAGTVTAVDRQNGCFRFSATRVASAEHLPHPYQSCYFADSASLFVSTTFGDPSYVVLSQAPELALLASADDTDGEASIYTGASNDGEMGAWNSLLNPIRLSALQAKVEEFLPFGLLPVFVYET